MTEIMLISNNVDFAEDLIMQINTFDASLHAFMPTDSTEHPDIILLDETKDKIADLKAEFPRAIFILLSHNDLTDEDIYKLIKKPFSLNDLLNFLASCVNLLENTQDGYLHFGQYELRPIKKEILCLRTGKIVKLTEKEVAILKYLYNADNRLVYKNELLEEVWNYSAEVSTHTLETHIYRLRQKVEKGDKRSKLIATKDGGYLLKR